MDHLLLICFLRRRTGAIVAACLSANFGEPIAMAGADDSELKQLIVDRLNEVAPICKECGIETYALHCFSDDFDNAYAAHDWDLLESMARSEFCKIKVPGRLQ